MVGWDAIRKRVVRVGHTKMVSKDLKSMRGHVDIWKKCIPGRGIASVKLMRCLCGMACSRTSTEASLVETH